MVGEAVHPAPFQWNTICKSSNCAADPPPYDQGESKVELEAEGVRNVKDSIVHEEDAKFCGTGDAEIEDGSYEGELQVLDIVVRIDVGSIGVFGNPQAIGIDAVC